jgi:hypothetical protein
LVIPFFAWETVRWEGTEDWVNRMGSERDSFAKAVTFLMGNGNEDMTTEIAANVWRLWVLAKDDDGGRKLLAPVLE